MYINQRIENVKYQNECSRFRLGWQAIKLRSKLGWVLIIPSYPCGQKFTLYIPYSFSLCNWRRSSSQSMWCTTELTRKRTLSVRYIQRKIISECQSFTWLLQIQKLQTCAWVRFYPSHPRRKNFEVNPKLSNPSNLSKCPTKSSWLTSMAEAAPKSPDWCWLTKGWNMKTAGLRANNGEN